MEKDINYFNYYNNIPILVTGGAGFIGSKLVKLLVKYNAKVTILDNFYNSDLSNLDGAISSINIIKGSIEDLDVCVKAICNKKIVFHLAAIASVPTCEKNPIKCYNTNINGTSNVLEASRINKVSKVVFSSSSAVYGDSLTICKENTPCIPISTYGYSKLIGEILCKQYTNLYNLHTVILRYFNVYEEYSKNKNQEGVIAKFKNSIKNNNAINIYGDGLQVRDFVEVNKVIESNLKVATPYIHAPGEIFNIASGKSINLIDLFNKLKKENPHFNKEIEFKPSRKGDIQYSKADITKYKNLEFHFLKNIQI